MLGFLEHLAQCSEFCAQDVNSTFQAKGPGKLTQRIIKADLEPNLYIMNTSVGSRPAVNSSNQPLEW